MILTIPCKEGNLQVTDDGMLRVVPLFGKKPLWQVAASSVTSFASQPGTMFTLTVTIVSTQGTYTVGMVSKPNFEKLQKAFPSVAAQSFGKEWYHSPTALTHVATYQGEREMQTDVEHAYQYGWQIQGTTSRSGQMSGSKVIAGAIIAGPVGALIGAKRGKDKITVTFVRTQEWLAQHS